MSSDNRLFHCSEPRCPNLVYGDEAIPGDLCTDDVQGRFCVECARGHGYFTPDDVALAEALLRAEGLITDRRPGDRVPKAVRHRPPKLTPGQQVLL
jgi:hypothetical protein